MGTLGQYLHDARVEKEIDLRDAAQQTRISIQYLKALENEDFTKLPGEVFVKGFLKNYGRFLNLDEAEIMKRYAELKSKSAVTVIPSVPADSDKPAAVVPALTKNKQIPIEPFVWGAVICVLVLVFLFASFPSKSPVEVQTAAVPGLPAFSAQTDTSQSHSPEKLYLELIALEDTWLLVRTDGSPQKKAVLKQGENLIWSADERFLLSYGNIGSLKLVLNGEEIAVNGPKVNVVRDLAITRAGIVNQPAALQQAAKRKPLITAPADQPSGGEQKPVLAQPAIIEQKPTGTGQKPALAQPAVAEKKPSGAEQKPSVAGHEPAVVDQKRSASQTHAEAAPKPVEHKPAEKPVATPQ